MKKITTGVYFCFYDYFNCYRVFRCSFDTGTGSQEKRLRHRRRNLKHQQSVCAQDG